MESLPTAEQLKKQFLPDLQNAKSLDALNHCKVLWLGRKGRLTQLLKKLGTLPIEQKRKWGPAYNQLKSALEQSLSEKEKDLQRRQRADQMTREQIDVTLPADPHPVGTIHPVSQVLEELVDIFRSLGYVCADGPEIESEFYNFEALNIPADHPARDMQDTFYLQQSEQQLSLPSIAAEAPRAKPVLLRTHTSPVQVRVLQKFPPPVAVIVPGRVFRNEAVDATHGAVFHQLEGLLVDRNVSLADLKGTLDRFAKLFYGPDIRTRFRPSYFPFTEPSAEMDISCLFCGAQGCSVCKQTGWLELLGAGMVNPRVLSMAGLDTEVYNGFAFGIGIERLAMFKYRVNDLRLFYDSDQRFLEQF